KSRKWLLGLLVAGKDPSGAYRPPLGGVCICPLFFFDGNAAHLALHSFPTRRSSDLSYSVFARIFTGTDNACCCQPEAVSLANVSSANNTPAPHPTCPTVTRLPPTTIQKRSAVICPATSLTTPSPNSHSTPPPGNVPP